MRGLNRGLDTDRQPGPALKSWKRRFTRAIHSINQFKVGAREGGCRRRMVGMVGPTNSECGNTRRASHKCWEKGSADRFESEMETSPAYLPGRGRMGYT
jgi:hypothetical protein